MATDSSDFLLKDLVVEPGLEFTLSGAGGCDVHCCLSTTKNDEILVGSDRRAVQRRICYISLHDFEVTCVDEL